MQGVCPAVCIDLRLAVHQHFSWLHPNAVVNQQGGVACVTVSLPSSSDQSDALCCGCCVLASQQVNAAVAAVVVCLVFVWFVVFDHR